MERQNVKLRKQLAQQAKQISDLNDKLRLQRRENARLRKQEAVKERQLIKLREQLRRQRLGQIKKELAEPPAGRAKPSATKSEETKPVRPAPAEPGAKEGLEEPDRNISNRDLWIFGIVFLILLAIATVLAIKGIRNESNRLTPYGVVLFLIIIVITVFFLVQWLGGGP